MKQTPAEMDVTPELLAEIASRSANGEGVRQILAEKGLEVEPVMLVLRDKHIGVLTGAKQKWHKKEKDKQK